MVSYINIPVQN